MTKSRKLLACLLIVSMAGIGLPLPVQAGLVGTEAAVASGDRGAILSMLDRADVRAQLEARGVNPAQVKARVAALTDAEAAEIAARIDELPAGGILGFILLVFVILLITDILGLTKVFPFTRPVR
jgi:uncharacterized protein DUF6627